MMQNSKTRKVPIRGNSNLFDNHNDLLNSGNKDEDDIIITFGKVKNVIQ